MTGEGIFYAAQAAFSYRGGTITQWEAEPHKSAYEAVATALSGTPDADDETAAQDIAATLSAAIPGGLSGPWDSLQGLERAGVVLVVQAYRHG